MERTKKIGVVALLKSQKFDDKIHRNKNLVRLCLFLDECFEILYLFLARK